MCLAVPGQIVETKGVDAVVDVGGVRINANVAFVEDPKPGDYVLVHAGFAIRKWSEADMAEYRALTDPSAIEEAEA